MTPRSLAKTLNTALDHATRFTAVLVLPLSLLLFLQWPLRDVVGAGSRPANDLAQWIFALYVAFALRHTTRVRGHMAADAFAARYPAHVRERLWRFGQASCVLPWALFVLFAGAPALWQSLLTLEAFPDTLNPLYFVIKLSAWLLALLLALQMVLELLGPKDSPRRATTQDEVPREANE